MTTKEIVSIYPEKSFKDTFIDKESALEAIGTPKEQVERKRNELQKIFQYDNFVLDLKHILNEYNGNLDDYTSSRIKFHFGEIGKLNSWLSNLNFSNPNDINTIFQNLTTNINNTGYNHQLTITAGGRNVNIGKTLIDEFIFEIKSIINGLSNFDLNKEKEKIENALKVADKLVKNTSKYEDAIIIAENWIQAEGKALSSSLQDKAEIFNTKADEHKFIGKGGYKFLKSGNWIWLVGSIVSGLFAIGLVIFFIFESGTDISVGASLLRISVLLVISYFGFFTLSQFSNNKKLYEVYKFKAIALKTMDELIKSYGEDKDKILDKAISIVFNEPSLKEELNSQQKLLEYSMDILKKKI